MKIVLTENGKRYVWCDIQPNRLNTLLYQISAYTSITPLESPDNQNSIEQLRKEMNALEVNINKKLKEAIPDDIPTYKWVKNLEDRINNLVEHIVHNPEDKEDKNTKVNIECPFCTSTDSLLFIHQSGVKLRCCNVCNEYFKKGKY